MATEGKELIIRIRAENLTSAEFKKAQKQLEDIGKKAGFTNKGVGQLGKGFETAAQRLAQFNPVAAKASGLLGGFGPIGLAVGAGLGVAALGFRELIQESETLTKEAAKLNLTVEEYQKTLGRTTVLTNEAAEAGTRLGRAWDDLWSSTKNNTSNALTPYADKLSGILETITKLGTLMPGQSLAELFAEPPRIGGRNKVGTARAPVVGLWTEEHWRSWQRQTEEMEAAAEAVKATEEAERDFQRALEKTIDLAGTRKWALTLDAPGIAIPNLGGSRFPGLTGATPGAAPGFGIPSGTGPTFLDLDEDLVSPTEEAAMAAREYAEALSVAADLSRIIEGNVGEIVGQSLAAVSALENLSKVGGLKGAFTTGRGDATGLFGAIAGLGGVLSAVGPLIGPVVEGLKALFSLGGPDIGRDVGRDIGAQISEGLEQAIEESGKNAQLFLTEIFAEGGLGIDRFAEEVGDLLSMLEQGKLTFGEVTSELQEDLPIIVEHFNELGEVGRAQLERILLAADAAGIELGEVGDQLRRMLAGIPELTEEAFASLHDLTQEQVDTLEDLLDIDLDTQIERLASQFDVPVDLMETLAEKMESLGLDVTNLPELLEQLGVSFEDFFEKITGQELPEGAGEAPLPGETPQLDPEVLGDVAGTRIVELLEPALGRKIDQLGEMLRRVLREAVAANS